MLHFDALTRHFPVPGLALLLLLPSLVLGWESAAFGAYVGVLQGATALLWDRFGGREGSELWIAVFSGAELPQ